MAAPRGRRPLLAHLFAAPLVRESSFFPSGHSSQEGVDAGFATVTQRDYKPERVAITRCGEIVTISAATPKWHHGTLESVRRGIEFCSEVASAQNFLLNLTGCRVLHFTWNGDGNQEQVVFEEEEGLASPLTEENFQNVCKKATLPEVVVLSAASAKVVAGAFIRAGISNVVAADTSDNVHGAMLGFMRTFYCYLAQGRTLRDSFDAGVRSLPPRERDRCVLLPEDGDHSISPFDDVEGRRFSDVTPRLPRMNYGKQGSTNFLGREAQVQEVYTHMVKRSKVITIKGFPGIGKTEVALQACSYARERRLFSNIFFVSLQDQATGAPITDMCEVAKRVTEAFGISPQDIAEQHDGLVHCIQQKCGYTDDCLLVLDGCPPWFVGQNGNRIKLSWVVEQLCQRVSKLQYVITVVKQVGIAKEKVVNIGRLSEVAAAELFVASASREVTAPELRGGMVISGQDADCMSLFFSSHIMNALDGHPGAIVGVSSTLGRRPEQGLHLLRDELEYVTDIIPGHLRRYHQLDAEFTMQLEESPQEPNGGRASFAIEVEWNWCRPRQYPGAITAPLPAALSLGERLWNLAVERHMGAGPTSTTLPWKALYKHSLADHFLTVMGDDGRYRPLQDEDFQTLGANPQLWAPWPSPASRPSGIVNRKEFLPQFWPWFKAATLLLKHTGHWGNRRYPVICSLTTITRYDGEALLRGRPPGTFLVRVSTSVAGALVIMYVDRHQKVVSVPARVDDDGKFLAEEKDPFGKLVKIRAKLGPLIQHIPLLTHLFPDTPKDVALA